MLGHSIWMYCWKISCPRGEEMQWACPVKGFWWNSFYFTASPTHQIKLFCHCHCHWSQKTMTLLWKRRSSNIVSDSPGAPTTNDRILVLLNLIPIPNFQIWTSKGRGFLNPLPLQVRNWKLLYYKKNQNQTPKIVPRLKIIPPKKSHHLGSSSATPIAIPNYSATVLSKEKSPIPKPKRQRINPTPISRVIQQAGPDSPPVLSIQFKHKIDVLKCQDLKLVIQKQLSLTDMDSSSARLSIPEGQMRADFLAQEDQEQREPNSTSCKGMQVPLIEPSLAYSTIILKKWKLDSGISYIFGSGWQTVAKKNWLKADDIIQPWSFRVNQRPCLALVKL